MATLESIDALDAVPHMTVRLKVRRLRRLRLGFWLLKAGLYVALLPASVMLRSPIGVEVEIEAEG
jgi:hypothetical protein